MRIFNVASPVVFLGGLSLALALNAFAVFRLRVRREGGAVVGTVRLATKCPNIAVMVVGSLLLVTLVGYALLANRSYR